MSIVPSIMTFSPREFKVLGDFRYDQSTNRGLLNIKPNVETVLTLAFDTLRSTTAGKGVRLETIDLCYAISKAALVTSSVVLTYTTYGDGVPPVTTNVPITVTGLDTDVDNHSANITITTPIFDTTSSCRVYQLDIGFTGNATQESLLTLYNASVGASVDLGVGAGVVFNPDEAVLGDGAAVSVTTGTCLVAIGANALASNTSGNGNTAVGGDSLMTVVTSDNNTAVGCHSLKNVTGANNTGVGAEVGATVIGGSGNTLVGQSADVDSANAIDRTAIGNNAISTADYNVQLGEAAVQAGATLKFRTQQVSASSWVGGGVTTASINNDGDIIRGVTLPTSALVGVDDVQTLTNKTVSGLRILDSGGDNTYNVTTSNLSADRNVLLPLLTTDDTIVFEAFPQTLTDKTISGLSNTITDLSAASITLGVLPVPHGGTGNTIFPSNFVLVGGGVGPVTAPKTAPAGAFVGTTDIQTLTNKVIGATLINVDNIQLDGNTISSTDINGNINILPDGSGQVLLKANPITALGAATKQYVDGISASINVTDPVRVATTVKLASNASISAGLTYNNVGGVSTRGQITATLAVAGVFTVDSTNLVNTDRVLIKNEGDGGGLGGDANGIYVVTIAGTALTLDRATDFDQDSDVTNGTYIPVTEGATNEGSVWVLTTPNPIILGGVSGTTLTFKQIIFPIVSGASNAGVGGVGVFDGLVSSVLEFRNINTADNTHITVTLDAGNKEVDLDIGSDVATVTGTQTLTNKSLTAPQLTSTLIFDRPTFDLILDAADQTVAAPTVTIPNLAGVSDTMLLSTATQTLSNKTINNSSLANITSFTASNDLDIGSFDFRAHTFTSDASTGTAPFTVSSTTLVTNLNADYLNGKLGPTGDIVGTTDTQILTNKTLSASIITGATLSINDTASIFNLNIASTSNPSLTLDRTLTIDVSDADRTIDLNGNLTFASSFTTSGANALTLTTTGPTNVTLPTTGTLATLDGTETLTNKTINAIDITVSGILSGTGHNNLPINDFIITDGTAQRYPAVETATANGNANCVVIGTGSSASATYAVVVGNLSSAAAGQVVAIGRSASASVAAANSVAIGYTAATTQAQTVALGYFAQSNGTNSVSIGRSASVNTSATDSVALGPLALVNSAAIQSVALGREATVSAQQTIAMGYQASCANQRGIAIGGSTSVTGDYGVAIGWTAASSNTNGVALGRASSAGNSSAAVGFTALATGTQSVAIGNTTTAQNTGTIAIGTGAHDVLIASNAIAIGNNARGGNNQTVAIGINSDAQGSDSVAIGNTAVGSQDAVVIGHNATGSATNGIAIGVSSSSTAGGGSSIAIGNSCQSLNTSSIAIGQSCLSQGIRSVGIGAPNAAATAALATDSVVIGTDASVVNVGIGSIAIGNTATVSGLGTPTDSTAIGTNATVNNVADTVAIGHGATSAATGAVVIGRAATTGTNTALRAIAIGDAANAANFQDGIVIGTSTSLVGGFGIAIGLNSVASTRGVSIGNSSSSSTDAFGCAGGLAAAANSVSIGAASSVNAAAQGAICIGRGTTASSTASNSIAMGWNSTHTGAQSTAIGFTTATTADNAAVIGRNATSSVSYAHGFAFGNIGGGETITLGEEGFLSAKLPSGGVQTTYAFFGTGVSYLSGYLCSRHQNPVRLAGTSVSRTAAQLVEKNSILVTAGSVTLIMPAASDWNSLSSSYGDGTTRNGRGYSFWVTNFTGNALTIDITTNGGYTMWDTNTNTGWTVNKAIPTSKTAWFFINFGGGVNAFTIIYVASLDPAVFS